MGKNLRTFLDGSRGEIIFIKEEISPDLEISAFQWELEKMGKIPILYFENPLNLKGEKSRFPLVTNLFSSRHRCAKAIGTCYKKVAVDYTELESRRFDPIIIDSPRASVKEVIKRGSDIDLLELPILKHHGHDAGPYITAGVLICKDPETETYNLAFHRFQVKGRDKLGVFLSPASHAAYIHRKYERRDQPMPVAVAIGHHPAFGIGAQSRVPLDVDEYSVSGGLMGEPLQLVASETWGPAFLVPGDAEIVMEGTVPPHIREEEAPFGEFTRYYGSMTQSPIIHVEAITNRQEAIYHDIFVGHADNQIPGGFAVEAAVYQAAKKAVPTVRNVYLPLSGCCRFLAYVQMKKELDGAAVTSLLPAMSVTPSLKLLIAVDEDVDIFHEEEVMWAIVTRSQWDKDIHIVPRMLGTSLDPSVRDGLTAKAIIDATKPVSGEFARRLDIPAAALKKAANLINKITSAGEP